MRRELAERLENILVDVIENDDLDAYLLDVSSATWKVINEEEFALAVLEVKQKYMRSW